MKTHKRPGSAGLLLAVAALSCLGGSAGAAVQAAQTFRASADMIPVDVQVLDASGRPVLGLTAADFDVTIDRKARRVVSADIQQQATAPRDGQAAFDGATGTSIGLTRGEPRVIALAVDAGSFTDQESAGVVHALEGFLTQVPADSHVAFIALPNGPSVRPTTDRLAVKQLVGSIMRASGVRRGPLNFSPSEITEILNSPANPYGSTPAPLRGSSAPSPDDFLRQMQIKECGTASNRACTTALRVDTQNLQRQLELEIFASLGGLKALVTALRDYEGQKTIVLISSGMPFNNGPGGWSGSGGGEARIIGEEAARSRVSIYSLYVDRGLNRAYAPQARDMRVATSRSRAMEARVLYDLASSSGGGLISVPVDSGEAALARVLLETSATYLLGVLPEKPDLDGRAHALTVKLKSDRSGTVTRHRKFVVLQQRGPAS